ncbi:hypothetical protein ABZ915_41280 [Streptomyces sp. NPDC046915]|uniref:hypothetical protein n=1 Tax=Streptomyces sp. NPDC046915 TaxID=3155257 RepID=UPI0033F0209A
MPALLTATAAFRRMIEEPGVMEAFDAEFGGGPSTTSRCSWAWPSGTAPTPELFGYLEASGQRVSTKFELWRDLIHDISALHLDSYGIAERIRCWHTA